VAGLLRAERELVTEGDAREVKAKLASVCRVIMETAVLFPGSFSFLYALMYTGRHDKQHSYRLP